MTRKAPDIIEVTEQRFEELLQRAASNTLCDDDMELMRNIFASYRGFFEIVGNKNTTIARLRKMMFGATSEKSTNVLGDAEEVPSVSAGDAADGAATDSQSNQNDDSSEPPPGHGRYSADDYPGADQIDVRHPEHSAGNACPDCGQGTLYEKPPGVLVRFVGRAPLHATVYRMQKLRCHLCGKLFTAPVPDGVGDDKYDHTVASMIGLLKYGSGLPFNRLQGLQWSCEVPLAASTQWDIIHAAASLIAPTYNELIRQAAQGEVLYNDDTTVRILEMMGQRARKAPPPVDDDRNPSRTGLFTSGVVATLAGVRIALFFSGHRHAGENLSNVLQHRAAQLEAPVQMCDGLARNLPKELDTILANCLAHGRRNFVDLHDRFPEECRHVIEAFKVIYHNDKVARDAKMSAEARLALHQSQSKPTMDDLHAWLQRQLDDKLVEANSALGEAINYLLKRWQPLTLFLRKAGAPLDNNLCERALKKAILHRKNSMFYKTRNGARVGDMYMSLIYTCELSGANAFDYLNQLQINAADVTRSPDRWMPWNYLDNVESVSDAESHTASKSACHRPLIGSKGAFR
ncbi:IS66 family transposase [Fuerstiella marisgermanici]|nr:IS66 family transposase [Fuerstiella marisgermanici]